MAKSKKREKTKRRGSSSSSGSAGSSKKSGGAMMGMRSGIKGLAGSLVGQKSPSKGARRFVDIFWWVVTIIVGAIAAYLLYNRFK